MIGVEAKMPMDGWYDALSNWIGYSMSTNILSHFK